MPFLRAMSRKKRAKKEKFSQKILPQVVEFRERGRAAIVDPCFRGAPGDGGDGPRHGKRLRGIRMII
jgi:hypothetical protein